MKLKGKKALVIAAGQGIGRAIAEAFQREGAEVLGATLHPEKLQGWPAVRLDARDKEAVFRLIQGLDRLDVLVNAQGWCRWEAFWRPRTRTGRRPSS